MAMCKDKLDAEVYNAPLEPNANKVTQGESVHKCRNIEKF